MPLLDDALRVQPASDELVVVPHPRNVKAEHAAHPDSPVGRTVTRLAARELPGPLATLETRLGRPLLDLSRITDAELHAITDLVLEEKHRRAQRWFGLS